MTYRGGEERLFPGEAAVAFLPWGFMSEADKHRLTTQPQECSDCGMADLPWVAGWMLCRYCRELRSLRRPASGGTRASTRRPLRVVCQTRRTPRGGGV